MSGPSPLPLTDDEIREIAGECSVYADNHWPDSTVLCSWSNVRDFARAIESAVRASLLVPTDLAPTDRLLIDNVVNDLAALFQGDPISTPSTVERGVSNTAGASGAPKRV